uniref:Fringe glycosyltransferase-like isoform X1 n=1 Tax=Dermatophagoides pteronyssinus TaxID=6956 RepID=A0A6P6Y4X4_DERPT|nr:fringe glycosyltransferase-like isoform X1 [Dermatophagoides pteronyssinus]
MYTISMCLLFFLLFTMVIVLMPSSSLPLSLSSNLNHSDLLNDSSSSSVNKSKINIDDIFITVKTTRIFHKSRLDIILDTWYTLAKNQTYFFTDNNDPYYRKKLGNHIVNTNCSVSHNRKALCCKMSVEFDYYIDSDKKWWCHFDDDNYVNIPRLLSLLQHYDPMYDWYLGKTSIKHPLEIDDREFKKKIHFSFATGGAGFCISRSLALKMISVASNGQLISVGDRIRLPDDVTIGYIIEHMLNKKLTVIEEFHSHLEPMAMLEKNLLKNQVSFSYSGNNLNRNVLQLNQLDSIHNDSTRFYSLHCYLFPELCRWKNHR